MDLARLSIPFLKLGAALIAVYVLYAGMLFVLQRRMLFPGQFERAPDHTATALQEIDRFWIDLPEGRGEVWVLPPVNKRDDPAPAVIVAHGNAELIDDLARPLHRFREMGFALVLPEYPGYGRSDGSPTEESVTEAFRKTYDRITERRGIDSSQILAYGRSVGGGIACQLAADRPVAALILQSTFTRIPEFAEDFYVPGFLVKDEFDNLDALRSYSNPVLILHGRQDGLVPFSHARRLAEISENAELIAYDCGHNDCPPRWEMFWEDVSRFLQTNGFID